MSLMLVNKIILQIILKVEVGTCKTTNKETEMFVYYSTLNLKIVYLMRTGTYQIMNSTDKSHCC